MDHLLMFAIGKVIEIRSSGKWGDIIKLRRDYSLCATLSIRKRRMDQSV